MPYLHTRVFPPDVAAARAALDLAFADLEPVWPELAFHHRGWSAPVLDDEGGFHIALQLPEHDPDLMIRELRQGLGLAKWLALRDPAWWIQVWDDLQLVEATFGRTLAFLGGVVVDEEGAYDEALETQLAEAVAKIPLPGIDLGFPPGVPEDLLDAMDAGTPEALRADPAFVARVVAAVDRCGKLRRASAAEALARVLDEVADDVLRPLLVEGWAEHAPAARARLAGILERMEDGAAARDLALDLLFAVPTGTALDDAAAALVPWADDDALVETLMGVVEDEDAPPGPGTRVEGACADLLLRTGRGARSVARRARRDRDADPIAWWAVRKLLESPTAGTMPTIRLYARPGATTPGWLGDAMAEAEIRPPADEAEVEHLLAQEAKELG